MIQTIKWVIVGFLALHIGQAAGQTATLGAFVVVEKRTMQPNGQTPVSVTTAVATDTLLLPVRTEHRIPKRILSPKPAWPDAGLFISEEPAELCNPAIFYIMSIRPGSSAYEPGYQLRKHL